ncbi:MAG: 3-oxoacyl-[acyl-carrier-protein] synthase III C-terminal domain-containing protein [Mycobacterium sp.]|uniref:3-oxoacyl-[acyl-carrier-protein] synthase III C-terminal domain-containing protein n=1 Tax=Mycobacterium sp. TaxID=1785 RepID=UPI002620BC5B|nr:3-oxoacyl-[acyl-carrier-protein] synthase III C-terminal domain-containing protein [Mycobacterium sp.]MDI3313139.1 3-oxoacyl-[acyl-carrier-protein] synthase III C-terminal domain-containing protein [Mycobacterium sp.]
MYAYQLNSHGKIVFPSNCFPDFDFSAFDTLEQLDAVIQRDFDAKAPTGTDILERIKTGGYRTKYELMRDMALNLFWANRYAMTMYDVRPTRWADVPRHRDDVFVPIQTPWEGSETKVSAVSAAYPNLPAQWDAEREDSIFAILYDVFAHRRNHATRLSAVLPTVGQLLADPKNQTLRLSSYDPDFRRYSYAEIIDCDEDVPELEALHRWSMVLHNQYPWSRRHAALTRVEDLKDDDFVVVFHPRSRDVQLFLSRVKSGQAPRKTTPAARDVIAPVRPYRPIDVRKDLSVYPRIQAIAAVHGEQVCTNEDIIRNSAYNWSPMSAEEIAAKTGIEQRRYTWDSLEELALRAARSALAHAGVGPGEVGAVIVCTCTSSRLIPSIATWISGQLGIYQTHCSFDLVAACAGLSYGLAEAVRVLQTVQRPVVVVCAEKFSDKIGNVRPSRMIFGDGAAAIVIGPAPDGSAPDIDYIQTYASGPTSQVNSILWPNPAFANNITVYGPEVKALAGRYLKQMLDDIAALPDPDGAAGSLLDSVELIIPHQANKTMVIDLATSAGVRQDRLYFNIERVGNASSASIPLAIHDAVRERVITKPSRIFTPGFGAGAVAGYTVMRVDPAAVAPDEQPAFTAEWAVPGEGHAVPAATDVAVAFG